MNMAALMLSLFRQKFTSILYLYLHLFYFTAIKIYSYEMLPHYLIVLSARQ